MNEEYLNKLELERKIVTQIQTIQNTLKSFEDYGDINTQVKIEYGGYNDGDKVSRVNIRTPILAECLFKAQFDLVKVLELHNIDTSKISLVEGVEIK